jgi:hypothetical protein
MEKYLFTDGTNEMREVQSQEELKTLIESSTQPEKTRIWVFNSNEWIPYTAFGKKHPAFNTKSAPATIVAKDEPPARRSGGKRWLKKFLLFSVSAAVIFLVYNFTKLRWEKVAPLSITAARPTNVLPINADSLIQFLEDSKGQKLDKITKTNLRIRNTWPERIGLQLNADHDSSSAGSRYYNMELAIDNTTGYNLDNAIVKLTVWKDNKVSSKDTFHFNNISYAISAKRKLIENYRGDSLSISFQLIKAKVFNFCYSADKKSNYGNDNDRWFFRE